jgi:hypothetical protein
MTNLFPKPVENQFSDNMFGMIRESIIKTMH